jgi:phage-related protein
MGFFSNLWSGIKNGVSNLWNRGKEFVSNVWNKVSPVIRKIPLVGDLAANTVEGFGKKINDAGNMVANVANGNFKEVGKQLLKYGVDTLGGKIPIIGGAIAGKVNEQVDKLKKGGKVGRKPTTTSRFQRSD